MRLLHSQGSLEAFIMPDDGGKYIQSAFSPSIFAKFSRAEGNFSIRECVFLAMTFFNAG